METYTLVVVGESHDAHIPKRKIIQQSVACSSIAADMVCLAYKSVISNCALCEVHSALPWRAGYRQTTWHVPFALTEPKVRTQL